MNIRNVRLAYRGRQYRVAFDLDSRPAPEGKPRCMGIWPKLPGDRDGTALMIGGRKGRQIEAEARELFALAPGAAYAGSAGMVAAAADALAASAADVLGRLADELAEAEAKAFDSLAGYKFQQFGYWASVWVHVNRLGRFDRPSPFDDLVKAARARPGVRTPGKGRAPECGRGVAFAIGDNVVARLVPDD